MNSQASRKLKASAASTTRFMPARNAGKKRQHALGLALMAAIAELRRDRRPRRAEIDDREEESGERVDAEMRAEPRQAQRQHDLRGGCAAKKLAERHDESKERCGQACAIDSLGGLFRSAGKDGEKRNAQQEADAEQFEQRAINQSRALSQTAPAFFGSERIDSLRLGEYAR